ncbi:MAG TPA: N-acetylmuramoyl-L-alanine amidase [Xanthomonadaceae bacterium]|jgi:N-acetylmuramoyl-L-alanine amidase
MPSDLAAASAIRRWPLSYEDRLEARPIAQIDLVVIHCTELPDLAMAREFGERILHANSGTGNSGHWYVDRDGSVLEFVCPERIAHHVRGCNPRSVGIELVNTGRYPDWLDSRHQAMDEPYTEAQVIALIALLGELRARLPKLQWIAGHEDLDIAQVPASDDASKTVARKRDPGPWFPWERVLAATPLQRMLPLSAGLA